MAQSTTPAGRVASPALPPIELRKPTPFWASWRFLLGAIVVAAAYVYGWQLTDIRFVELVTNFPKAQHIVAQLIQPDILKPATTVVEDSISVVITTPDFSPPVPVRNPKPGPQIELSTRSVKEGETIQMTGTGWPPNAQGNILYHENALTQIQTDGQGAFSIPITIPKEDRRGAQFFQVKFEAAETGWFGLPKLALSEAAQLSLSKIIETIFLALIGTTLSVILSAPLSFLGARNVMHGTPVADAIYFTVRTVFNVLRSIEVLIIVVIWAVIVGIGSFAGVLAIAVHGIGALGKLYSESIESIDPGPIEALRATGASRLQTVIYAVLPQVVPQFISFTFYRWDINVRMATVIGLVGGGGIGFILIQYMNLLQWRQAATAIWLIIVVVMAMDYASSYIRHKVV